MKVKVSFGIESESHFQALRNMAPSWLQCGDSAKVEPRMCERLHSWLCGCLLLSFQVRDFPGGAVVKNPPANAGDMGSSPGPGRSHMPWSN